MRTNEVLLFVIRVHPGLTFADRCFYPSAVVPPDAMFRGKLDFLCPGCRCVIMTKMTSLYALFAPPIRCAGCDLVLASNLHFGNRVI